MSAQQDRPIPDSYWVKPGRLLAGEYAGALINQSTAQKVRHLLQAGVTFFLNLTEQEELASYEPTLRAEALALGGSVEHHRMAIKDMHTPTPEQMVQILDTIDAALARDETVYVHCWGGIGRTGTVVGCYLVRHGMSGEEALKKIAQMRHGMAKSKYPSPETEAQRQMILNWELSG